MLEMLRTRDIDVPDNECSIYFYNPSLAAAILFTALYTIPTIFTLHRINNKRSWYFLPVVVGGILEVAGYAIRIASVKDVCSIPLYATSMSIIVVAPLFVCAGNYILLGRLILAVLPNEAKRIMGIPPIHITKIFLTVDVVSFFIQAAGSAAAAADDWQGTTYDVGIDLLLVGLGIQVATILVFLILLWVFSQRAYFGPHRRTDAPKGWERAFEASAISTTLIMIRSVYRLIEFAIGIDGYPFQNEWTFYVLEAVPMLPAIAIFCLWFPPKYLPLHKPRSDVELGQSKETAPKEQSPHSEGGVKPTSDRFA